METENVKHGFGDIAVGGSKDYPATTHKERQKIRSMAWNHGAYHEKKFSSSVITGGIRITRIK